ncbi:MAG: hypothetical protein QOJ03_620 [Frankiaceae bacterium]|nr:hypothetical protein [Frankiaceae bacterium]
MTAAAVELPLDLRAAWRRARLPVVFGALFLGVALILAVVQNAPPERPLDPRDASPVGARALAGLVRDRGVAVHPVSDVSATQTDASTVLVTDPSALTKAALRQLAASAADIVAVAPTGRELDALGVDAKVTGSTADRTLDPSCGFGPAHVAGRVRYDGTLYQSSSPSIDACYPDHGASGLLVQQRGSGRTVVLGSATTFVNDRLADEGDAALALGLLSGRGQLLWVLSQPATQAPADADHKSLIELLPDRLLWLLLQLFVVVVVVALWRGRRLGPVIVEPLPVVVRAAETVEGRARLLRAARARGTAATSLRTATLSRLRDLIGTGADASPAAVVEGVARRTGQPGGDIDALLYGADPTDDAALVRLARDLDAVERAVRNS